MAYAKSWIFSRNVTPTDQSTVQQQSRSFLQQLKEFAVSSAGWTVSQSCDSTQVQSSDTWVGLSNIVNAASGAHSWIVLKSPESIVAGANGSYAGDQSRVWLVIDCNNANPYIASFSLHRVAPTSGTTSAAPTSANALAFSATQFMRSSGVANAAFHFAACTTGQMIAHVGFNTAGYLPFALHIWPVVSPEIILSSGWDYPYAISFKVSWLDSGVGADWIVNHASHLGWGATGTSATICSMAFCFIGAYANVSTGFTINNAQFWPLGLVGSGAQSFSTAPTDSLPKYNTTKVAAAGDGLNSRQLQSPMRLFNVTGQHWLGAVGDIQASYAATPQGACDALTGTTTQYVGNLWLPTNVPMSL